MEQPRVSVIIPLYNACKFLNETVQSVLNQSYNDIQIILVDDHSTDDSFNEALRFQSDKVIVRKNKHKGACAARNYGFELSTGDYIQFLDADDLLCADKIQKQLNALNKEFNKLALCETWKFKTNVSDAFNTDKEYLFSTDKPENFFINLWGGNGQSPHMVQTSAWLTPRTLLEKAGPWDETLEKDQDGEFFSRITMQSEGIVFVPGIKNYYRIHTTGKNIAAKKERKHIKSQFKALKSKEYQLSLKTDSKNFHTAMALQFKLIAIDSWPNFKDIHLAALQKEREHGGSDFVPLMGGKLVEIVKKTCGWKTAKILSHYGRKLKKRIA